MRFPIAVLPLQVAGQWVAVEALRIIEILGARPWEQLAGAPRAVAGVIAWRGRAVSLVDPGRLIGQLWVTPDVTSHRFVVTQSGPNHLVLPADVVREVQRIDQLGPAEPPWHRLASGTADLVGIHVPLINLARLVEAISEDSSDSSDGPSEASQRLARKTGTVIPIRRT